MQTRSESFLGLPDDPLPKRLKILNWGSNSTLHGTVTVGPRTVAALAAKHAELGFDKIGIDYEHQSVPSHPNFKPAPREYAGYGSPVVIEGEGLYLDAIEWTPSGQRNARNYAALSPSPLLEHGEVVFLHSVALCPQGAVKGLSLQAASFEEEERERILGEAQRVGTLVPSSVRSLPFHAFRAVVADLTAQLSPSDLAVCRQLSLRPEDFR